MKDSNTKGRVRIGTLLGTVFLLAVAVYYFAHPDFYLNVNLRTDGEEIQTGTDFLQIVLVILFTALGAAALWVPCFLNEKQKKIHAVLGFWLTSVVMIFVVEYANIRAHRYFWWVVYYIGVKKLFLTWVVVILFAGWFAVLTNRWQTSAMITAIVVCSFGVTCYFVYALRGTPFLASDLTTLGTAANVAAGYTYRLDSYTTVMILMTTAWCDLILWSGEHKIFSSWKPRVVTLIVVFALSILTERVYIHSQFLLKRGVTMNTFRPIKSYGVNGSILTFIRSIQIMVVEEPDGYSLEKVKEIEARYLEPEGTGASSETEKAGASSGTGEAGASSGAEKTGADTGAEKAGAAVQPNVIYVMDEAFSDMQSWMDFETDREVCPFFSGLKENTIRGKLYVSSYGGRTANTEYEVLTGDSMGFLPVSSTPYQLYIKEPMPNLDATLENQGYRHTVGMHPYKPSGYNRRTVYELFGFDRLLFEDEFAGAEEVYGRVSDLADIDRVIAEYEEAKRESDAPFFVFNVTMQNHSPYTWDVNELEEPVHVTSGSGEYVDADVYLSEIHLSDKALEKLVHYFEQTDDPTVIVFFGDHQPLLEDPFYKMVYGKTMAEMKDEELMQFYHSNYLIWANYDIEEKEMDLSSNYLAPVMKQAAGMELTGYDRFLLDLHEDLPIVSLNGYWDRDGVYYGSPDNEKSPWYDRLQEYNLLVYNHLFDKENRTDDFFGGNVPDPGEAPADNAAGQAG